MRTIFSTADKTVAYLGHDGLSKTTFSAWNFLERESEEYKSLNPEAHKKLKDATDFQGDLEDVEIDVLSRVWFRRVWVLQEVVVSKRIVLVCGSRSVSWDDFCQLVLLKPRLHDRYGLSVGKRDLYSYVKNLFLCRCVFQESIGHEKRLPPWYKSIQTAVDVDLSALALFHSARKLEATDTRDKIYSLLGISSRFSFAEFPVDYNMGFQSVCMNFARHYILTMESYDILSHADNSLSTQYESWVPNWLATSSVARTILSTLRPDDVQEEARRRLHIRADNSSFPRRNKRLRCFGSHIGTVQWSSKSIEVTGKAEIDFEKIKARFPQDEPAMNFELLREWERLGYGKAKLRIVRGKVPLQWMHMQEYVRENEDEHGDEHLYDNALARTFNELGILEQHLIMRSRQTVEWSSDDGSKVVDVIVDATSIVDGRSFAKFKPAGPVSTPLAVALVPKDTREDDLIVSITGARIPFVVREVPGDSRFATIESDSETTDCDEEIDDSYSETSDDCKIAGSRLPRRRFWLIGECLINNYGDYDSLKRHDDEEEKTSHDTIEFIFH